MDEVGRRERKKRETREALRAAALRLVAERGLEHVTVEEIADAVDVTSRTFFNHFASKEDAVVGPDPRRLEQLRESLSSRPLEETPLQMLEAALCAETEAMTQHQDEHLLRQRLVRENPKLIPRRLAAFGEFERVLVEAVAARIGADPDRDLYPTLVAGAALAALRASLRVWRIDKDAADLGGLVRTAFAALTDGLSAPQPESGPPAGVVRETARDTSVRPEAAACAPVRR